MKKRKKRQAEYKRILAEYGDGLDWFEEGELQSWVDAGNSPYTNPEGTMHEDGTQLDFVEWHRSARWITEEVDLHQPSHFDYILSCANSKYTPHNKKEAIKLLRQLQQLLGNEILDLTFFLRAENLMEKYISYKYSEELPFV